MDYKKSRFIYIAGLFAGLALLLISAALKAVAPGVVGMVLIAAAVIQTFIFHRCPKCRTMFPLRGPSPKFCPGCGHELDNSPE